MEVGSHQVTSEFITVPLSEFVFEGNAEVDPKISPNTVWFTGGGENDEVAENY